VLVIASMIAMPVSAQTPAAQAQPGRQLPAGLVPVTAEDLDGASLSVDRIPSKVRSTEVRRYSVQLADAPLAKVWIEAQEKGLTYDKATAESYAKSLADKQAAVAKQVESFGGKVLANYSKVFNGLAVEIAANRVVDLYKTPGVVSVLPIPEYTYDLDETVPWIGAAALQEMGYDGAGIRVAVIDTGIDYTHEHLGGSGLQADTDQALAEASQPADPAEMPDPNPMDDEAGGVDGHGTHVASIIGGVETANLGPGVAPGVEFYALKVCSSVSTSCSGVAMLQSYDWAADPNGDYFFDDRADVINISIGSVYGQPKSADTAAVSNLVGLGSVVAISAGNSGNMPYITGAPSVARPAISVAQTSVPSAILYRIRRNAPEPVAIMDATWQPWSLFPTEAITGDVVYGNGDGTNLNGCAPFTADLTGKVSVINRGACTFTSKVLNAEAAGASMAIIALVAPGDPFEGGWGGEGYPQIPGFMVSQANGNLLKVAGANVTIDPNDPDITIPLLDVMVGSSSRGPAFDLDFVKPNIGAPGASVSASSGHQSYATFGGTSGAAPMVAGSAALVLQAAGGSGSIPPVVVKAKLMNNAVTDTWQDVPGGKLNPITRQGAGRVDVEAAVAAETIAWVPADNDVALSFGFETVSDHWMATKTVEVINTTAVSKTYEISGGFRYADDADTGVEPMLSATTLTVDAGGTGTFDVTMHVTDPLLLKAWPFTSGSSFANGDLLTDVEYDGFVTLTADDGEVVNLPWHFLPRQAADVMVGDVATAAPATFEVPLMNDSVVDGAVEVYPLFDISPEIVVAPDAWDVLPADLKYVGADVIPWDVGENLLLFPVTSWTDRSHPITVEYDVWIDVDQDGVDDYVAYNSTLNGTADPRAVSVLVDLAAGTAVAQFFIDTTINTDNMVIPVIVPDDDYAFNFQVFAFDAYFTGDLWDVSPADAFDGVYHVFDGMYPAFTADEYYPEVPAESEVISTVTGHVGKSPSQIGMLYRVVNGVMGGEVYGVELPKSTPINRSRRFDVSADSFMDQTQPNTNFGSASTMWFGYSGNFRPIVQMDFSSVPSDAIVTKAYLYLYIAEGRGFTQWDQSVMEVSAHAALGPWAENAVTWNAPWDAAGGDVTEPLWTLRMGSGRIYTWLRFDVTEAVEMMVNGTMENNGFVISANSDVPLKADDALAQARYGLAQQDFWDPSKVGYLRIYFQTATD
jgi:subtilisin family serine protease